MWVCFSQHCQCIILSWYSSIWCKDFSASVIRNYYTHLSLSVSLILFLCSATIPMKGISMSFCAKVQRTCLLWVLRSQFVMHILFCVPALHLITLWLAVFKISFVILAVSQTHICKILIECSFLRSLLDCSVYSYQLHLDCKVSEEIVPLPPMEIRSIHPIYSGNRLNQPIFGSVYSRWSKNSLYRQASQIPRFFLLDIFQHSCGWEIFIRMLRKQAQPEWRQAQSSSYRI